MFHGDDWLFSVFSMFSVSNGDLFDIDWFDDDDESLLRKLFTDPLFSLEVSD